MILGSDGSGSSLLRRRETQTRRYCRSPTYSGPQTLLEQLGVEHDLARVRREALQQHPLGAGQVDQLPVPLHQPAAEVDLDALDADDALACWA